MDLVGSSSLEWLPDDYEKCWTLKGPISCKGICLHSGEHSEVTLLPHQDIGFHISWINSSKPPIKINSSQVVYSQLCTTLSLGEKKLSTVEHLLAALVGCGLTHVHIVVSGNEIPLLDGSALPWVEAIQEVGIVPVQNSPKHFLVLEKNLIINKGASLITAIPADCCRIIGIIDFPYKAIGKQMFSFELTPRSFVKEIAPARTFGFKDQIDKLMKQGLIKGGTLSNSLVCDGESWINPPLRYEDEPVRHKLLDLIGDLAFVGLPKAQVLVYRGSHALHAELADALTTECSLTQSCFD